MTEVVVCKKTFEELVAFYKKDLEGFERWRKEVLKKEILRYRKGKRKRLRAVLHNHEMRLRRFGNGTARYNAVVGNFFNVCLADFDAGLKEFLHGPKHPRTGGNVVAFLKHKKY